MVQYDALQSLLGIATQTKDSPLNSQALILQSSKRRESFFAEPAKTFTAIEENKEAFRKIKSTDERVQTEVDNTAVLGVAQNAIILHKEKDSPKIKVYSPEAEEKSYADTLDMQTTHQLEETDTTQETVRF